MPSSQHNQVICPRRRLRLAVGALALFVALWALTVPVRAAGLKQGALSPSALAAATDSLTGASDAGQVSIKDVCAAPGAGRAGCLATLLDTTANGQALSLRPTSAIEPARTVTGAQNPFTSPLAALASAPASAPEPAAGTPAYLQQAYDLSALSQTAGTGDTVAIVDAYDDPNAESDLAAYRANYGLPACSTVNGCFEKVNESGGTSYPAPDTNWAVEISLDLDAVSALCPNCHITLVEANSNYLSDLNAAESEAVALGAQQVSNSWAAPSAAGLSGWSYPGIAILASAGDSGWWGNGAAYYPASLPTVTSVGGTSLSPSSATASAPRGFSESAWGYQWQGTWYGTGSGCDTSEQKPTWQTDSGCQGRSSTDISADADPSTGLRVYDTYQTGGGSGWFAVGGTSLSSPLSAAYYALTQAQSANPAPPEWAYTNAAELNDPSSGQNGACGNYICQAGPGYDGPTGNGSISGDVVAGAPGIGGPGTYGTYSVTTTSSGTEVSAGIYPNGLVTSVFIQYGTTNAYGQQSTAVDAGSSSSPQLAQLTISGLTPGNSYHYRLVAQNAEGTTYGYDFTLTAGQSAPVNQTRPSVSGTAQEGSVLSASAGSWTGVGNVYSYEWQRSTDSGQTWAPIATGSSYTPGAGDLGAELEVLVSAANAQGSATAASAPTGAVTSGAPVNTRPPAIAGTPANGQNLSASPGAWTPASLPVTYQWQEAASASGTFTNIAATTSTYTPIATDLGKYLQVVVSATDSYGTTSATSAAVGPVTAGQAPVDSTLPAIAGTPAKGQQLSASSGAWMPASPPVTYQWQEAASASGTFTNIAATTSTYTPIATDLGKYLRVVVSATDSFGTTPATSAAVGPVAGGIAPVNSIAPIITGTVQQGDPLSASTGTWAPAPSSYSYQWQRSPQAGGTYTAIAGASAKTYKPVAADVNYFLEVVVSASGKYGSTAATSAWVGSVLSNAPHNTKAPTVSGTVVQADTLSGKPGTWSGATSYKYQWLAAAASLSGTVFQNVAGATQPTFKLTGAQVGKMIELQVTAINANGFTCAYSNQTAAVAGDEPTNTLAPALTGTPARGDTLSVTTGTWTGSGLKYSYLWQRGAASSSARGQTSAAGKQTSAAGRRPRRASVTSQDSSLSWANIAGAKSSKYAVQVADEGDVLRVLVTATNAADAVSAASKVTATVRAVPPVNTLAPALNGTARRGSALTATHGTWTNPGKSYTYQWQSSVDGGVTWPDINGASAAKYTVAVADEGHELRVQVTTSDVDGPASADSAPTAAVAAVPPINSSPPKTTGAAKLGVTLHATAGVWTGSPTSYAYQWQSSPDGSTWTDISSASASTYTVQSSNEGNRLRVRVTASNQDGPVSSISAATSAVPTPPSVVSHI
ncbi:MAG: hypothetical protein ACLP50_36640 [Solirubrobacteraceae bacterium]